MSTDPVPGPATPTNRPQITVREVVQAYLDLGIQSMGEERARAARQVLAQLVADYGGKAVSDCRAIDLLSWLKAHPAWKSDWTIKNVIAMVKRVFSWAVLVDLIPKNPFLRVTHQRGERGRPMTQPEYRALLRHTDARFRRLLVFLRYTGARPGEASAMTWTDVNFELGCISLKHHKTSRWTRRPRLIVMAPVVTKLLRYLWRQRPEAILELVRCMLANGPMPALEVRRQLQGFDVTEGLLARARKTLGLQIKRMGGAASEGHWVYELPAHSPPPPVRAKGVVFLNERNSAWTRSSLSLRMQRLRQRVGFDSSCKLYGLRHKFGTDAILNGVGIKSLSELLGHSSTHMSEHYVHIAGQIEHLRGAVEQATRQVPGKERDNEPQ